MRLDQCDVWRIEKETPLAQSTNGVMTTNVVMVISLG
ncbi:hypothetical protein DFP75_11282 [Marinomonas alcarazii]|uniref:Uncharacterized protein n=1 Tax=Marinomonas alcarazii TaxID=491949 RepID=A0A318USL0_9GAMM|nr:hypothetical protein DFP75_11282 [Marinomonas alcarazii]